MEMEFNWGLLELLNIQLTFFQKFFLVSVLLITGIFILYFYITEIHSKPDRYRAYRGRKSGRIPNNSNNNLNSQEEKQEQHCIFKSMEHYNPLTWWYHL